MTRRLFAHTNTREARIARRPARATASTPERGARAIARWIALGPRRRRRRRTRGCRGYRARMSTRFCRDSMIVNRWCAREDDDAGARDAIDARVDEGDRTRRGAGLTMGDGAVT